MMRIVTAAISVGLAGILLAAPASAQALTARSADQAAQASQPSDVSAQRRPLRRVPIYRGYEWEPDVYPRYYPGRNAVRDCTASYVQEYRPSGTVIVPHMNCYWRRG